MSESYHWVSQPVFSHQESQTSNLISINLESGIKQNGEWPNHFPLRISVTLRDIRVMEGKAKIELEYVHLNNLVTQLAAAFKDFSLSCDNGAHIAINKYAYRTYKNLVIDFLRDGENNGVCRVKVVDPHTDKEIEMIIRGSVMRGIAILLQSCLNNYPIIASNMMIAARQDKHFELIKNELNKWLPQISSVVKAALNTKSVQTMGVDKSYLEEQPHEEDKQVGGDSILDTGVQPDIDIDSNRMSNGMLHNPVQSDFDKHVVDTGGFGDIDLDIPEGLYEEKETSYKTHPKVENPFLLNFLGGDISNLSSYATSVYSVGKTTIPSSFLPLNNLLKISTVEDKVIDNLLHNSLYTQYALILYIKVTVANSLSHGFSFLSITPPSLVFQNKITKVTPILYETCEGMLITLLIYSLLIKRIEQLVLGSHTDTLLQDLYRTFFTYKSLVSPFIFSLDMSDPFSEQLNASFQHHIQSGIVNGLEDKYSNISTGGKFQIPIESFQQLLDNLVQYVVNCSDLTIIGDYESECAMLDKYNLPKLDPGMIKNSGDIRREVFAGLDKIKEI